jgi:NADH-quinone oxidoreductase subunit J
MAEMDFYRTISEIIFWLLVLITMGGGILAIGARMLIYSLLGLSITFLGVAGLYIYLGSFFLSVMQVLIYGGAICIVLVFGIMVGYTPRQIVEARIKGENLLLAVPTCVLAMGLSYFAIRTTGWSAAPQRLADYSIERIGRSLMYDFSLCFELISLLLLLAMIGAIIVVNSQEEDSGGQ